MSSMCVKCGTADTPGKEYVRVLALLEYEATYTHSTVRRYKLLMKRNAYLCDRCRLTNWGKKGLIAIIIPALWSLLIAFSEYLPEGPDWVVIPVILLVILPLAVFGIYFVCCFFWANREFVDSHLFGKLKSNYRTFSQSEWDKL